MLDISSQSTCYSVTDPVQELVNLLKDISLSLRKTRHAAESIYDVVKTQLPTINSSLYEGEEKINGSINSIAHKQSSNPSNSIAQLNSPQSSPEKRMNQSKKEYEQVTTFPGLTYNNQVSQLGKLQKEANKPQFHHESRSQQASSIVPKTKKGTKPQDNHLSAVILFDRLAAILQKLKRIQNASDQKERHRDIQTFTLKSIQLLNDYETWPISEKEASHSVGLLKKSVKQTLQVKQKSTQHCRMSTEEHFGMKAVWSKLHVISLKLQFTLTEKSKWMAMLIRKQSERLSCSYFNLSMPYRYQFVLYSLLFYSANKMGNDFCSCPHIFSKNIDVPDLKLRSTYGTHTQAPDERIVQAIFAQSVEENRKSMVAKIIESNKEGLFTDDKFTVDSKETSRLSVLFDYERMKTKIYSRESAGDLTSFIQLNIEFCYLTCVSYFLCQESHRLDFMKQIFETKQTNRYGAYSMNFYCNGEKHNIVIDDQLPTQNDSFLYLRIVKGVELWPLIIEKGWCKQIGSYQRAKGLSPEDAFEEITGIPAYSYQFKVNNRGMIEKLLRADPSNNWITLVARNNLDDLKNRQVFYLQSIDENNNYTIISPYSSFNFLDYKQQRRGEVKVKEEDIFTHFQYAAIGFYRPKYVNTSISIDCKSHEEVLIDLYVRDKEDVSIRFSQYYEGYLKDQQREHYDYSPVLIELYKVNENAGIRGSYTLVQKCQGCQRSIYGARTAHISSNIFEQLHGKYLIRMEVSWSHEDVLHKGNLVAYSSSENVEMRRLSNNGQMRKQVYPNFFDRRLPKQDIHLLKEHNIEVRIFYKKLTTLFAFRNLYSSQQSFEVDFSSSKNIFIRGGTAKDVKTTIVVQGEDLTVIEVVPLNIRLGMQVEPFKITKLDRPTR